MRTDQRHEVAVQFLGRGLREKAVDHLSQFVRVGRVETSRHKGRPDLLLGAHANTLQAEYKQCDGDK